MIGRRSGGGDVDVFAQDFDFFLLVHPEALFFIHHQQAQLIEGCALAQQLVSTDHCIDRALLQAIKNGLALGRRSEAIQQGDFDRIRRKAFG